MKRVDPPSIDHGLDGGYVHKPGVESRHICDLPAEWLPGAVWRCVDGHLWVVGEEWSRGRTVQWTAWVPASWLQRVRHSGRRARRDMANVNRYECTVKPPPPRGRVPVPPADFDG